MSSFGLAGWILADSGRSNHHKRKNRIYFLATLILKVQNHAALGYITCKVAAQFFRKKHFHDLHYIQIQPLPKIWLGTQNKVIRVVCTSFDQIREVLMRVGLLGEVFWYCRESKNSCHFWVTWYGSYILTYPKTLWRGESSYSLVLFYVWPCM